MRKKKIFASLVSSVLLASTLLSTGVAAETTKGVTSTKTGEQVTIGKDYQKPKLTGKWVYNKADNTFTWELNWERITYAKSYKIYRIVEGELEYKLIATIDKEKIVEYKDSSFEFGKNYSYKLNYIHGNREVDLSDEVKADYKLDSDKDGLYDILEFKQGADAYKSDTDGDGLLDGYEVMGTQTNFLKVDTDGDGVTDDKEDFDEDKLVNLKEKELDTNPNNNDTDFDSLVDGDEVEKGTDPKNNDSDGDGLKDGYELTINLNPLKKDTDDDGILDGDEQIDVTTTSEDSDGVVKASVTIESKASEGASTTITSVEGEYSSLNENMPGYIAAPYEFHTSVDFDSAKMQFKYDDSLNGEGFRPAIYYFNEESQMLEKVANQTVDEATGTVTATVNHFSIYLLLNEIPWEEAWQKEMKTPIIGEDGEGNPQYVDVVFSIDSSGSMSWNDPDDLRKEAAKSFVDKLRELDQAAVVDFDGYARTLVSLTTDREKVKFQIDTIDSDGGTNLYAGLNEAVNQVIKGPEDHKRFIIFLTDGDGTWYEQALQRAKDNHITVYTIGLGDSLNESLLRRIASETGGKYYHASNAGELKDIHDEVADETVSAPDTDKDGLADVTEEFGFRTETGEWITTDPNELDTDGDGLSDGEEAGELKPGVPGTMTTSYFFTRSNPTKKDTDDDGIHDNSPERVLKDGKWIDYCSEIEYVTDCADSSPKKYNFNNFVATLMTDISYVDMEDETKKGRKPYLAKEKNGKIVTDLGSDVVSALDDRLSHNEADRDDTDNQKKWNAAKRYLKGWKVIKAEDSAGWDSGLGALALKKGSTVVIAYRGSEMGFGGITKDWLGADLQLLASGNNIQVPGARDFAYDVILDNPDSKVYVLGHSLGGFLAQIISYEIIEKKIDKAAFWFWNEWELQNVLDNNPNMLKRGITFNAAPFTNYNLPFIDAIPHSDAKSDDYDDLIYNYSINSDPLSEAVWSGAAVRVGRDIPELDYTTDSAVDFNAHIMLNFYQHFK